jgi:DNA polymerase phi
VVGHDASTRAVRAQAWKTTVELLGRSERSEGAGEGPREALEKRQNRALALLLLYNGLELLSEPEAAVGVLQELQECHQRMSQKKEVKVGKAGARSSKPSASSKRAGGGGEEEVEEEEELMSVLVELLVSLLARPSAVLRSVVKSTFRAFVDVLTPASVDVLLQVLSDNAADLFDEGEDGDDSPMDEDDEDEDEEDEDDDDEEGMEEDGKVAAALSKGNAASKQAPSGKTGKRKAPEHQVEDEDGEGEEQGNKDSDEDSSAEDDDDDGDEWDDNKMFEMDRLIGAAVKSRLQEQQMAKQTSRMSVVLKLRTLELLEVLLSRKEPSALVLTLVEPMLDLAISGGSGDKKVGESAQQRVSYHAKVTSLYADKLCRLRPVPAVTTAEQAKEVVEMLERFAQRLPAHAELAGCGIAFLLRVLAASGKEHAKAYEKVNMCTFVLLYFCTFVYFCTSKAICIPGEQVLLYDTYIVAAEIYSSCGHI